MGELRGHLAVLTLHNNWISGVVKPMNLRSAAFLNEVYLEAYTLPLDVVAEHIWLQPYM